MQTYRKHLVTFFSAVIFTSLVTPSIAQAQQAGEASSSTGNQSQPADPLADLRRQVEEATLRRDLRQAQQQEIRYSLPAVGQASQALDGTTQIQGSTTAAGNTTFESQILAYQALQEIVEALASEIGAEQGISSLVVLDETTVKNLAAYQAYFYLYSQLNEAYKSEASSQESPLNLTVLEVPTTILRSVAEFLALFRTDTTINNFQIQIPREALVVQLTRQLRSDTSRSVTVRYPAWYSQNFAFVQAQLQELFQNKRNAQQNLLNTPPAVRAQKEARLKALQEKFDEFMETVSSPDALAAISTGATIAETLSQTGGHVLFFKLEAGGSNRTTRNLFFGSRTRHSGGAILNYALFNPQGETVTSNTLYYHTGYVRVPTNEPITNINTNSQQ